MSVLGKTVTGSLERPETWLAPEGLTHVTMTSDEVTAVCPATGQRDFYTVSISFRPNGSILESKSLKMYLAKFVDTGISCEQLACTIQSELCEVIEPWEITVTVSQKSRGGITISSESIGPHYNYETDVLKSTAVGEEKLFQQAREATWNLV